MHNLSSRTYRNLTTLRFGRRPLPVADENGQAIVEFTLVALTFIFLMLGVIQMALIINAYTMVRYAAYNAARAGVVHGGDEAQMQEAARISLLSIFPRHGRADTLIGLMQNYEGAKATDQISTFNTYGQPITKVEIIHPDDASCSHVVTFDDPVDASRGLLTVKVTHSYQMVIPFVNRMLFYVYSFVRSGSGYQGESVDEIAKITTQKVQSGEYADIEFRLPLSAEYTMRMQSDFVPAGCS